MSEEINTEQRILSASRKIFAIKGYHGTTMEDIAREANVSKASLHYYYRSKSKLFDLIFDEALTCINDNLLTILNDEKDFDTGIKRIIDTYINFLFEYPYIPNFIIHEFSSNPNRMDRMIKENKTRLIFFFRFLGKTRNDFNTWNVEHAESFELMLNILSLCVFPFLIKPIITHLDQSFENNFDALMNNKKIDIANLIVCSIKSKNK